MSIDGKLLARARAKLSARRAERERGLARREAEVTARVPRAKDLLREISATMAELAIAALGGGENPAAINDIRDRNLALQDELERALISAGFPRGYLNAAPHCIKCDDKGYIGVEVCPCVMELYRAEQKIALSALLKAGDERFENFDLSYYGAAPDPATGVSHREHMRAVYNVCLNYAKRFNNSTSFENLFLTGEPGLGKTFLAACIARHVAESGAYSVVYDGFPAIFARMENEKFGRTEDEEARAEIRRVFECDLLIADDLGAEMRGAYTSAAMYELTDARLTKKRRTIITSNLSVGEVYKRYSSQVGSRIEGEYQVLSFYGSDIRIQKRERM